MVTLPKNKSSPETNLYKFKMFLAGDKKIGKTSFANSFDDPFIIQFEPGNDAHIACRSVQITDTMTLSNVLRQLKANPSYCKTLVVDGVQMLYELIWQETCEEKCVTSPDEGKHGIVWGIIGQKWRNLINEINSLDKLTIFTAHGEMKRDKNGNDTEYDAVLMSQVRKTMKNLTHMWFYMVRGKQGSRQLIVEGNNLYKASYGCGPTINFGGAKTINLGNSPEEAQKAFMDAWNSSPSKKFKIGKG